MPADPPLPRRAVGAVAGLFRLRPSPPRWPNGARAAISAAIPILIGWAAGDLGAGLIATLGAFTCRFGSGRPYRNRDVQLAAIGAALATAITLGAWAAPVIWLAVGVVSAIAVVAVWVCSALEVGPPGAYVFVIVCAAGIGVSASHLPPWHIGLLVLAGAAIAWTTQMVGVLVDPRGPEKAAVSAAGDAVATAIEHAGSVDAGLARGRAAEALYRAWTILVGHQAATVPTGGTLDRLRQATHALHVLFADAMRAAALGLPVPDGAVDTARGLAALTIDPATVGRRDPDRAALRQPRAPELLRHAVTPGAHTRRVMVRVAIAAPVAGALAALVGAGHIYWAIAAAVLVLHLGMDRRGTLQRGVERLAGTWIGLALAAGILLIHPQGVWLALVVAALQFAIETTVTRNYVLASIFITAAALTVSSASHPVDVGGVLVDRGLDTLIGCSVGVAVFLLASARQESDRVPAAVADVLRRVAVVAGHLAGDGPGTVAAREARRTLQRAAMDLSVAREAARGGSPRQRMAADRLDTTVTAAEGLAYLAITTCWSVDRGGPDPMRAADAAEYRATLDSLADRVATGEVVASQLAALDPRMH
ncbi:FUSC family protein [Mycolicibacterium sediminis]|uniref:FUSC family protein n=1 Tax=Mycolicibacterium sediminis TaxID=1286180 RepID=A0A7I7QXV1_9MYCO|nr:FUSC family protein [Mycolicibacterium sediminis]BBY30837.1 FUSC family protein [Mycolicibacterium sediminis]